MCTRGRRAYHPSPPPPGLWSGGGESNGRKLGGIAVASPNLPKPPGATALPRGRTAHPHGRPGDGQTAGAGEERGKWRPPLCPVRPGQGIMTPGPRTGVMTGPPGPPHSPCGRSAGSSALPQGPTHPPPPPGLAQGEGQHRLCPPGGPLEPHRPHALRPGARGGPGGPPPTDPKEYWLSHVCTGGRQNKAQKKMWLVSGLQDHRYLSVKSESKDARG